MPYKDPEAQRAYAREHYKKNIEKRKAQKAAHQRANPDAYKAATERWRERNPHKEAAKAARRRTAKLQRTPSWADLDAIEAIYQECARVSQETGEPHHVDHIVPLQGVSVSGLHVPANLQIIPARDNSRKGNKWN